MWKTIFIAGAVAGGLAVATSASLLKDRQAGMKSSRPIAYVASPTQLNETGAADYILALANASGDWIADEGTLAVPIDDAESSLGEVVAYSVELPGHSSE